MYSHSYYLPVKKINAIFSSSDGGVIRNVQIFKSPAIVLDGNMHIVMCDGEHQTDVLLPSPEGNVGREYIIIKGKHNAEDVNIYVDTNIDPLRPMFPKFVLTASEEYIKLLCVSARYGWLCLN